MQLNRQNIEDKPFRLLIVGRGMLHTVNWVKELHTVVGGRVELHLATDSQVENLPEVSWYALPCFASFPIWGIRGILNRTVAPCWAFFKIRFLIKNIRPDIVHLQSLFYPGWVAGLCVHDIPLVVTPWDGDVMWRTTRNPFSWARTKYLLRRASLITCVSQHFADYCKGFLSPKSSTKSIQAHFGYNPKRFSPVSNRSALKSKLGLPEEILVLSARQIAAIYDIETLLSAIKIVVNSGVQNVHFVFIYPYANKKLLKEFQALIKKWGLKSYISWIGKVDHRMIPQYYQSADIFVSTALDDTGPVSMVEAMACGCCCVMGDLPSVRECIIDGETGLLVKKRDKKGFAQSIKRLVESPELRTKISLAGREKVRKYQTDIVYKKMYEEYKKLVNCA